jgi:hypothetical protein
LKPLNGSFFSTRDEATRAAAASLDARAHRLLTITGFPVDAAASFRLAFTSEPDIEEGAGRFYFFR